MTPDAVTALQRTAGNRTTAHLLTVQRGTETAVLEAPTKPSGDALVDALITKAGLDPSLVAPEQRTKLAAAATGIASLEQQLETATGPKNKDKRSKLRTQIDREQAKIDALLTQIRKPLLDAAAAAEAKSKQEAQDRDSRRLEGEKAALVQAIAAAGVSKDAAEILNRAVALVGFGSRFDEVIQKAYSVPAIVEACRAWGRLSRLAPRGFQFQLLTELHSPGWQDDDIKWKQRGPQQERTRNLVLKVQGRTANIHVHPTGGHIRKN